MKFAYKWKANQYTDQSHSVCVRWVFLKDFSKHVDSNIAPKTRATVNIDMLFYLNNAYMSHYTFLCTVFLIEVYVLFTTKPYSTHTKMRLVIVLFCLYLICRFHWDWRSNCCLYYDCRVKILDRSLKRSVTLFGKR